MTFRDEYRGNFQRRDRNWRTGQGELDGGGRVGGHGGASITSAPASVLSELGVEPATRQLFQFAQGETMLMDIGYARVRFEGREIIMQVLFNDEGTQPLLGAMALEGAYMGVDPIRKRLVPVPGLMM